MKTFIPTKKSILYTASKDETVTLEMWNRTDHNIEKLFVSAGTELLNNNDTMGVGAPNDHPDTVHEIELLKGESIVARCAEANAIEYKIK